MQYSEQHQDLTVTVKPWYRYGIMWLVTGLPFTVVIASLITINIAINNKPDIVTTKQKPAIELTADPVSAEQGL